MQEQFVLLLTSFEIDYQMTTFKSVRIGRYIRRRLNRISNLTFEPLIEGGRSKDGCGGDPTSPIFMSSFRLRIHTIFHSCVICALRIGTGEYPRGHMLSSWAQNVIHCVHCLSSCLIGACNPSFAGVLLVSNFESQLFQTYFCFQKTQGLFHKNSSPFQLSM